MGREAPASVQDLSDEALFQRYREGDHAALRELIGRYQGELLRFLYRLLGDQAAAEDVFQETFLQLHLSSESFDPARRLRPWLFTIAANKGRDFLRKRGRRRESALSAPLGADGSSGELVDLLEIDVPQPGEGVEAEELSQRVQQAIETLSPALREILLLAYFQRLSYVQISEELGIPLGTVKSRLHAAVAAFGRAWKQSSDGAHGRDDAERRRGSA